MITPFKNRQLDLNKPAFVYRNLHRGGYSIQQGGRVVAHANELVLTSVVPNVCAGGRLRVVRDQVKNVHAKLCGFVLANVPAGIKPQETNKVTYNPYKNTTFQVWGADLNALHNHTVLLHEDGVHSLTNKFS